MHFAVTAGSFDDDQNSVAQWSVGSTTAGPRSAIRMVALGGAAGFVEGKTLFPLRVPTCHHRKPDPLLRLARAQRHMPSTADRSLAGKEDVRAVLDHSSTGQLMVEARPPESATGDMIAAAAAKRDRCSFRACVSPAASPDSTDASEAVVDRVGVRNWLVSV